MCLGWVWHLKLCCQPENQRKSSFVDQPENQRKSITLLPYVHETCLSSQPEWIINKLGYFVTKMRWFSNFFTGKLQEVALNSTSKEHQSPSWVVHQNADRWRSHQKTWFPTQKQAGGFPAYCIMICWTPITAYKCSTCIYQVDYGI